MSLTNEERQILVQRELEKAYEAYEDIEILKARGRWNGAANRLYYSVFHAVNALFINDGLEAGRHKTSHSLFSMHYVKEQDIIDGITLAADFIKTIEQLIREKK